MTLEEKWPNIYKELLEIKEKLEDHFKDVCDIEFVVENGRLFILGCRIAKRTSEANIKFTLDFFGDGKIDINEALSRIRPFDITEILKPQISNIFKLKLIGKGLPASGGAATGIIVFDEKSAQKFLVNELPRSKLRGINYKSSSCCECNCLYSCSRA